LLVECFKSQELTYIVATFSFKSVGVTQFDAQTNALNKTKTPVGILTPLKLSTTDGLFVMSYSLADQVNDNLKNLLLTNWGERILLYYFGANLRPLLSELATDQDFGTQAIQRISDAVSKWMPYIELNDFSVETINTGNKNLAIKDITVTYDVPSLGVKNKSLKVRLYAL
jgi:phage baseplate assembly protein W